MNITQLILLIIHIYRMKKLSYKFVEFMPNLIENNTLYISIEYCTAIHKCMCGCDNEVVTPLSPTDWKIIFDGKSVSLSPSIGNWGFDCKSHYWIRENRVEWAKKWSDEAIEFNRKQDKQLKSEFFNESYNPDDEVEIVNPKTKTFWTFLKSLFNSIM